MDVDLIERLIARLESELSTLSFDDVDEAEHLRLRANRLAGRLFGENSSYVAEIDGINFVDTALPPDDAWRSGTAKLRRVLKIMEDERALDVVAPILPTSYPSSGELSPKSVFVVHGHDLTSRTAVENMLRKCGLDPIILDDKANSGATIIEKIERYSEVKYAVAILSADDVGCAKNERQPQPRARQNVVFELGFFFAKLGRPNVAALLPGDIEAPSDIHGVLWIKMDGGSEWEKRLIRELVAAGLLSSENCNQ